MRFAKVIEHFCVFCIFVHYLQYQFILFLVDSTFLRKQL